MTWILIDLAIALAALAVLAVLVLGLWRRVRALSRAVTTAGQTVASATEALEAAQAAGPLGGGSLRATDPSSTPSSTAAGAPADTEKSAPGQPSRRSLGPSSPRRGARP